MNRTERIYYLVLGLYHASWSFLGPVYPLFLIDRGLDLFEVNCVLATYFVAVLLFEVPTGAVADRFGRKASFVASCAIRGLAHALYWTSHSFPAFALAEFIDAIGTTLATGALDAWAVDGMYDEGRRSFESRLFANGHVIARAIMIVSGLAGGYLASIDIALPWVFAASGFLVSTAVAERWMREPSRETPVPARRSVVTIIRESVVVLRQDVVLQLLCGLTAATALAQMPAMVLWPPRIAEIAGREMPLMGWIWVLLNLVALLASAAVSRFGHTVRPGAAVALVTAVRGLGIGLGGLLAGVVPAVAGILVLEAGFGASDPILQARMSDGAKAEHRATVLSLRSVSFTFGAAMGLLSLGLAARSSGIAAVWLASAGVLLAAAPAFLRLDREGTTPARSAATPALPTPEDGGLTA
jgi:MFS family permease